MPIDAPFVAVRSEWMQAAVLYGRLSATEWEVLLTVARLQWGLGGRDTVPVGAAALRAAMPNRGADAIAEAVRRLTRSDGHNMLVVVREPSASQPRTVSLRTTWMDWNWSDPEALAEATTTLAATRPQEPPPITVEVDDGIATAARLLREHCEKAAPGSTPAADGSATLARWCATLERLASKHGVGVVKAVIRFVHADEFWSSRIVGTRADASLERNFDQLYARAKKAMRNP